MRPRLGSEVGCYDRKPARPDTEEARRLLTTFGCWYLLNYKMVALTDFGKPF